ncbi:MAG: phosphotransferase family protein, partial [Massilia sp.]
GGRSQMELFLEPTRSRIHSQASQQWLAGQGITIPRLDARLLNRYFADFAATGFLPSSALAMKQPPCAGQLQRMVESALAPAPQLCNFSATPMGGETGILSELAAARSGGRTGLWHCQGRTQAGELNAVLKLKPDDAEQDALMLATAALCSAELEQAFADHLQHMPYRLAMNRERAIAQMTDPRIARHMPATLGILQEAEGISGILYGYLDDVQWAHGSPDGVPWSAAHLDAAVRGMGEIHAVWLGREQELLASGWIAEQACGPGLLTMGPLWEALADFAGPRLAGMLGRDAMGEQRAWIASMDAWLPASFAMPRTLIHHDFNPRNLAFWPTAAGLQLCAYDWELATLGLPQYDLVELLCHVLPDEGRGDIAASSMEAHRAALEAASGQALDRDAWRAGMALALRCFIICRIPMYVMVDRFRPQAFLPRVVRNAWWLAAWLEAAPARRLLSAVQMHDEAFQVEEIASRECRQQGQDDDACGNQTLVHDVSFRDGTAIGGL